MWFSTLSTALKHTAATCSTSSSYRLLSKQRTSSSKSVRTSSWQRSSFLYLPLFFCLFLWECTYVCLFFVLFFSSQLVNAGEDVLVFYNDRASFQTLVQMMRSERDRMDENSPLMYHIHLVELLAVCTEGKNVYTEIKCNSLLPLDDIVRVVTHEDCIPEVGSLKHIPEIKLHSLLVQKRQFDCDPG